MSARTSRSRAAAGDTFREAFASNGEVVGCDGAAKAGSVRIRAKAQTERRSREFTDGIGKIISA
jgi:hypothetical protein